MSIWRNNDVEQHKREPRIQTISGAGSDQDWALDWFSFVLPKVETNEVVDLGEW